MPMPTPGGVPVVITSPGCRVKNVLRWLMISATEKIIVAVLPDWQRVPFTSRNMSSACGSGTSSGVTSQGPTGPNPSQDLPLTHCPPRSIWKLRSERSLTTQ